MVRQTNFVDSQIRSLISQYGTYRTKGEYGRSAFWLWLYQIKNYAKNLSVRDSHKIQSGQYKFTMKYGKYLTIAEYIGLTSENNKQNNPYICTKTYYDERNPI